MKTHFKLMTSYRGEHAYEMRECDDMVQYKRVCPACELEMRKEEFEKWSDEAKEEDPDFATEIRVQKDMQMTNKDL